MRREFVLISVAAIMLAWWCGCSPREETDNSTRHEVPAAANQLRRVPLASPADADSLVVRGYDVIVAESSFAVVRTGPNQIQALGAAGYRSAPIQETDLVQRLVKVPFSGRAELDSLSALGIDIWEVREDYIIAQVFDEHVRGMKARGFVPELLERDIRNLSPRAGKGQEGRRK